MSQPFRWTFYLILVSGRVENGSSSLAECPCCNAEFPTAEVMEAHAATCVACGHGASTDEGAAGEDVGVQVAAGGGAVVQGAAMGDTVAAAAGQAVGLEVAGTGYYEVAPPYAGSSNHSNWPHGATPRYEAQR